MAKSPVFKFLSKENTAPFMLVSLLYCLFLSSPFLYFTILKSKVHKSYSVGLDNGQMKKSETQADTTSIEGGNNIPLNKFDKVEDNVALTDEGDEFDNKDVFVATNNVNDWKKDADSRGFIMLTKISIFSLIFSFGALGAAISLITRTRNNEYGLNKITTYEILSIQTIGGIFALILGFAFMGNMIAGTLFPNPIVFTRIIYVQPALGKLVVWSFIAGFFERFVPNILGNFSKKAEQRSGV